MLGRPGSIRTAIRFPEADGTVHRRELHSLLDVPAQHARGRHARCPTRTVEFLRFVESTALMPGQSIEVEARDAAADSVRVRGTDGRQTTIGTRAASKLLVEVLPVLLCAVLALAPQRRGADRSRPGRRRDRRDGQPGPSKSWTTRSSWRKPSIRKPGSSRTSSACCAAAPASGRVRSRRSGRSPSVAPAVVHASVGGRDGGHPQFGDMLMNYRYQWRGSRGRLAFRRASRCWCGPMGTRPRLRRGGVADQPAGRASRSETSISTGTRADAVPQCRSSVFPSPIELQSPAPRDAREPVFGGQRDRPRAADVQPDVRDGLSMEDDFGARRSERTQTVIVSPGMRGGWNIGSSRSWSGWPCRSPANGPKRTYGRRSAPSAS